MKTRRNRNNRNRKQHGGVFDGMWRMRDKRQVRRGEIGQNRLNKRTKTCVQRCMKRSQVKSEDPNPEEAAMDAVDARKESREQEEQEEQEEQKDEEVRLPSSSPESRGEKKKGWGLWPFGGGSKKRGYKNKKQQGGKRKRRTNKRKGRGVSQKRRNNKNRRTRKQRR